MNKYKNIFALVECKDSLLYLIGQNFNFRDSLKPLEELVERPSEVEFFDEVETVLEGKSEYVLTKKYKRSSNLRRKAIEHYKDTRGSLNCDICSFDFEKTYGKPVKNFIEMHHLKPVYMYKDEDEEKVITEAIENLLPVCANCHRVIHSKRPPYKIDEVREFSRRNLKEGDI